MKACFSSLRLLALGLLALPLVPCCAWALEAIHRLQAPAAPPAGCRLPPTSVVTRANPRLLNYHHLSFPESRVAHKEERLAQWDVLVLNHDDVQRDKLSLAKIRRVHPRVKILAWVPLQGPNDGLAPGVPREGPRDWYAKTPAGKYLAPHWGGRLMNAYAEDLAWPRHVLRYATGQCLAPGAYDGVMFDCLWEGEPADCDVNGDQVRDARDKTAWQAGMLFLLEDLRKRFPEAIVTGNGGLPWSDDCPYWRLANGCMHENALGDQFGGPDWRLLWDGYRRTLAKVQGRPAYHLIAADVRAHGRSQDAAARLDRLTENDLRRLRLGLATTLLLDAGYFGFDRGDCLHGQLWWRDEYDLDLGDPLGPYREGVYGPGSFSRAFARGLVVVNPTAATLTVKTDRPLMDASSKQAGRSFLVPPNDARLLSGKG